MNRSLLVSGLLLIAMIGCSTKPMKVQTDHASGFPFSTLKTYGFVAQGPSNAETDAARKTAERLRLDDLVQGHVRHQLAAKGYQEAPQAPDFRIAWAFGEWALDNHKKPNGGWGAVNLMFPGAHGSLIPTSEDGRALPPSEDPYSSAHEEAQLEIIITDARTSKVIWNGTVRDEKDFGYFRSSQSERIGRALDEILEQFPPPGITP